MEHARLREILTLLLAPPSTLQFREAISLLCTCRGASALDIDSLSRWYCAPFVRHCSIEHSLDVGRLWRQLAGLLQAVRQASAAADLCGWCLESADDLRCAVRALQEAKRGTTAPREVFLATISGDAGSDYLTLLRRKWDSDGHRGNMATTHTGNAVHLETREGPIEVNLLCEMRRFVNGTVGLCFAICAIPKTIGLCWASDEEFPSLFCASATAGVDLFSLDVFRFSGKPGTTRRGAVTHSVVEADVRRELGVQEVGSSGQQFADRFGSLEDSLEEDVAAVPEEVTSDGSEHEHEAEVRSTARVLRRLSAGGSINIVFALHGRRDLLMSPRSRSGDGDEEGLELEESEDEEEEEVEDQ